MNSTTPSNWRVIAIDDNAAIHEDYKKVLISNSTDQKLADAEAMLFGDEPAKSSQGTKFNYEIDSAFQGQEGFEMVKAAMEEGREYSVALIDIRMPPGCIRLL